MGKVYLLILGLSVSFGGCFYDKQKLFEHSVNSAIGNSIQNWGTIVGQGGFGSPGLVRIEHFDSSTIKYVYRKGLECEWFFLVQEETQVIVSWGYLSEPKACQLETGAPK